MARRRISTLRLARQYRRRYRTPLMTDAIFRNSIRIRRSWVSFNSKLNTRGAWVSHRAEFFEDF